MLSTWAHTAPGSAVTRRRPVAPWASAATVLAPLALAAFVAGSLVLVAGAAGGSGRLVPAAHAAFPSWLRGPLAALGFRAGTHLAGLLFALLFASYLAVLATASRITRRALIVSVVALHLIVLLGPPLFSADVFGYADYARLGVVHGVDPYRHGRAGAPADPVATFVRWRDAPSPYGPLFTTTSYALARASVPLTLWAYKILAVLCGLGMTGVVARLAARAGRDPVRAAGFVALNPLYLLYAVGGAHNDLLVGLLVLLAVAAVDAGRDGRGGALVALAALTKVSAGLALPFLLLGVRAPARAFGAMVAAAAAVAALSLVVVGPHVLGFTRALVGQQHIVARGSVPAQLSRLLGQDHLPAGLRAACLLLFVVADLTQLWRARRGADWVACAGWATLAALVTSAWLTPWYVVWVLPLAAVASSPRLRTVTLVFCGYVLITRFGGALI